MKSRFSLKQFVVTGSLFLVLLILPLAFHSSTPRADQKQTVSYTEEGFIKEIAPTIQEVAGYYSVRPSIIIAQAALESDFGKNLVAAKYNNLFAVEAQTGDSIIGLKKKVYESGKWQTKVKDFTVYGSWEASVYDYFDRLKDGQTWGQEIYPLLVANKGYKKPAQALQDGGFSSDPDYAQKLIAIIEDYKLTEYDNQ